MWGLDAADPRVAIPAMQEMNASVRNAVFFSAFFLTPFALAHTLRPGVACGSAPCRGTLPGSGRLSTSSAGLSSLCTINVPMNEELAGKLRLSRVRRGGTAHLG